MGLVSKIFWGIVAVEAMFFIVAFFLTATKTGPNPNGGLQMALVFQIGIPFLILAGASLAYWRTTSPALQTVLLIVIVIPLIVLAAQWIRGPMMDRDIAVGGHLYKDPKLTNFVAAIAGLNFQKVRELASQVDVNATGELGMTPLKFAIEQTINSGVDRAARLDMIRLLLSLGAKANSALPSACLANPEATGVLLNAGADPNYKDSEGQPAFFSCLSASSGRLESLRLFAAKGAVFDAKDAQGQGALIKAATFSQWDSMLFFVENGVKDVPTPSGKTAASMVVQALADDRQNSRETSPMLRQLAAKLP